MKNINVEITIVNRKINTTEFDWIIIDAVSGTKTSLIDKDYEEFYGLLPTMILMDMQEELESKDRKDIVEKISKDYAIYLTTDKVEKVKKIKETTKDLENMSGIMY